MKACSVGTTTTHTTGRAQLSGRLSDRGTPAGPPAPPPSSASPPACSQHPPLAPPTPRPGPWRSLSPPPRPLSSSRRASSPLSRTLPPGLPSTLPPRCGRRSREAGHAVPGNLPPSAGQAQPHNSSSSRAVSTERRGERASAGLLCRALSRWPGAPPSSLCAAGRNGGRRIARCLLTPSSPCHREGGCRPLPSPAPPSAPRARGGHLPAVAA